MDGIYSKEGKNIIEFMWKSYGISILISIELENDKNILGKFVNAPIEGRTKFRSINIALNNIKSVVSEEDVESAKLFVVLHEVGHFLLDKSGYIQKEEYADFLACLLAKKLLSKHEFLNFIKSHGDHLIPHQIMQIENTIRDELFEISELFFYKYKKYIKLRGEL